MKNPRLSVIVPCYNQGQYLLDILNCFTDYWNQNVYEVIFINDGSTDKNTLAILEDIKNKGISVINQMNQGVCIARNNAIKAANGEYILPLDGDDIIHPEFIYNSIQILDQKKEYSIVYCDAEYFGEKIGEWKIGEFNLQRLMLWNYMHVSAVFRKSLWEKIGGYDTQVNGLEDWDLWLGMAFAGGKFYYIDKPLFKYRILNGSANRSLDKHSYSTLIQHLEDKHSAYLGKSYINDQLILNIKNNKKLWLKLVLSVFFPKLLNKLIKRKVLDGPQVFY